MYVEQCSPGLVLLGGFSFFPGEGVVDINCMLRSGAGFLISYEWGGLWIGIMGSHSADGSVTCLRLRS